MNQEKVNTAASFLDLLAVYHRHEVIGIENLPTKGRCLIASNHSLATYDIGLLSNYILKNTGRLPRALMDRWFFKFDFIRQVMDELGAVEGNQESAKKLLENEELLTVAPGGMRESIRSMNERYQILWDQRIGFVRLATETQTPIVLAACPKADDIFDVLPTNKLSLWVYKKFKLPLAPFRGLGPTPIPRPVKLVHFLSEPLIPPKLSGDKKEQSRQISKFHKKVIKRMHSLIGEAIAYRS